MASTSAASIMLIAPPGGWRQFAMSRRKPSRNTVLPALALMLSTLVPAYDGSPDPAPSGGAEEMVAALRAKARRLNGFLADMSVQAGGTSQTGTLLFLAPASLHMEIKVAGLGDQKVMSDGRILWTVTPEAHLATKVDLEAVQEAWHRPLPNQAAAIRDVFEVMKPGTVRFVREESVGGETTRLFEGVPENGVNGPHAASLPDRVRAWVGEDGLLRRQVLQKGGQVMMDATFRITDKNPRIGPGLFRFDPPVDYQIQDLTDSTLKALQSIESPPK